jgi:hypothetical protein
MFGVTPQIEMNSTNLRQQRLPLNGGSLRETHGRRRWQFRDTRGAVWHKGLTSPKLARFTASRCSISFFSRPPSFVTFRQ